MAGVVHLLFFAADMGAGQTWERCHLEALRVPRQYWLKVGQDKGQSFTRGFESAGIVRRVGYLREDYWIPKRG